MSNILSFFSPIAPTAGTKKTVSGPAGKKSTTPLSGDDGGGDLPVSSPAVRKKKTSFLDHLRAFGEAPPVAVPVEAPLSRGTSASPSGSVKKAKGKTPAPSLSSDSRAVLATRKPLSPALLAQSSGSIPTPPVTGTINPAGGPLLSGRSTPISAQIVTPAPALLAGEAVIDKPGKTVPSRPGQASTPLPGERPGVSLPSPPTVSRPENVSAGLSRGVSAEGGITTQPAAPLMAELTGSSQAAVGQKEDSPRSGSGSRALPPEGARDLGTLAPPAGNPLTVHPDSSDKREMGSGFSGKTPTLTTGEEGAIEPRPAVGMPPAAGVSPDQGGSGKDDRGDLRSDGSALPAPSSPDSSGMAAAPVAMAAQAPDSVKPSIDEKAFVSGVSRAARQGGGEVTLRVHPPALGPIRIHVHVDPKTRVVEVKLVALDESVGELLRGKSEDLKGALSREGFTMHHFHVESPEEARSVSPGSPGSSAGSSAGDSGSPGGGSPSGNGGMFTATGSGSGGGFSPPGSGGEGAGQSREQVPVSEIGSAPSDETMAGMGAGKSLPENPDGFHRVA